MREILGMRLASGTLAALCVASSACAASFTVGPLAASSTPTLAAYADLSPGPSPMVRFTPTAPVEVRISTLTLNFDDLGPQVSNEAFTVELGAINASAEIPLNITQDVVFQLHTDPIVITFAPRCPQLPDPTRRFGVPDLHRLQRREV